MISDNDKDQKLERDIINAVKAHGLQESMNRWAKTQPKNKRRFSAINIVLISVAATVLLLIILNISIRNTPTKEENEPQIHYCKKDTPDTFKSSNHPDLNKETFSETSDNGKISNIALPRFYLDKYSRLDSKDSITMYLQNAEDFWNHNDLYRTQLYADKVIERFKQIKTLDANQQEALDYAHIYRVLSITYMQNPEFTPSTIKELERVSNLTYPETRYTKYILNLITEKQQ